MNQEFRAYYVIDQDGTALGVFPDDQAIVEDWRDRNGIETEWWITSDPVTDQRINAFKPLTARQVREIEGQVSGPASCARQPTKPAASAHKFRCGTCA